MNNETIIDLINTQIDLRNKIDQVFESTINISRKIAKIELWIRMHEEGNG